MRTNKMKIERSVSQEYLSNDNLKTIYTRSAGVDFGELAIIVLLSIVVYESTRFSKCGTNEHWVKTHTTKDGIVISGHCAKDPRRR
jgi:lactate dehydrogenase-like 2-hydroxyacid dehydrogenase